MKTFFALLASLAFLASCLCSSSYAESWEEFVRAKKRAETPRLIPKGGVKPRLLRKDIVVREIERTGQINLGPESSTGTTSSDDPQRPDIASEALLFEYGLPVLRPIPQNDQNIRTIASAIKDLGAKYPHYFVDGHTCDIGSEENNCRLSWARAKTIYDRLVSEGIDPQALTMRGFGENPNTIKVPNTSEENRKLNRRVVLIAYGTGPGSKWKDKDIEVVEGSPPQDDKDRFKCSESAGGATGYSSGSSSSTGSSYSSGSTYSTGSSYPSATEIDVGDWEKSDRLQTAAKENLRQADMAAAVGDQEKAEALRAAAEELEKAAMEAIHGETLIDKGKHRKTSIPRGFKPMHRKTPTPKSKGSSTGDGQSKERVPAGFKPMR